MKRDWTEIVKDKLSESTATPPDDLWAGISSQLDAAMPPLPAYRKSKQWRWWTVAACLATVLILYLMHNAQFTMHNSVEEPRFAEIDEADINGRGSNGMEFNDENPPNVTPNVDKRLAYTSQIDCKKDQQSVQLVQSSIIGQQQEKSAYDMPADKSSNSSSDKSANVSDRQDTITNITSNIGHRLIAFEDRAINAIQSKSDNGISIGLYASNTNMPSLNGAFDMSGEIANAGYPWNGVFDHSPTDDYQSSYTVKEAKHRQPLRFGLSVRLPVSSSLSLSSGLVYSRLSSTLNWESTKGASLETDQTLNYIGIPASIEYSLPSYRSAGFYLTAGSMVEKCIYGESKSTNSPLSEKVSENALQLSVFAGAGVQLNLNNHISLYVEPLATYYIDNHSDVINIYKDRKLNLDLRVGLRYTLK